VREHLVRALFGGNATKMKNVRKLMIRTTTNVHATRRMV